MHPPPAIKIEYAQWVWVGRRGIALVCIPGAPCSCSARVAVQSTCDQARRGRAAQHRVRPQAGLQRSSLVSEALLCRALYYFEPTHVILCAGTESARPLYIYSAADLANNQCGLHGDHRLPRPRLTTMQTNQMGSRSFRWRICDPEVSCPGLTRWGTAD